MAKIRYGKWGCWIPPVGVLLGLFAVITAQQPGFLSISCGGETNHTAENNNITWITDAHYINVGQPVDIGDASDYGSYLHTLRLFRKPLNKSCYQLPLVPNATCLLRLSFVIGNFSGFQNWPRFSFSIETVDILAEQTVIFTGNDTKYYERIFASSGTVLYVCLIRTSESDDPFVSAIELRPLRNDMYDGQAKPGSMLKLRWRTNIGGGESMVRYPQDNFDRLWSSNLQVNVRDTYILRPVSSGKAISTSNTKDLPPMVVMQTACVATNGIEFPLNSPQGSKALLVLYFAEIQTLDMSETRSFYVEINGKRRSENIALVPNNSAVELTFPINASDTSTSFILWKTPDSTLPPIINAYEYYDLVDTEQPTYSQDRIGCDKTSSARRISEIDLWGRNLTGSVPNDLAKLIALVNV